MAGEIRFHEKALAIYGVAQTAEGQSAVQSATQTTGTITTVTTANTITGVGTAFLLELPVGAYLYDNTGAEIGQIATVTNDTTATLTANAAVAVSGATFATGLGAKNALAVLNLNYSTELSSEAFQYTGDELSRDEETVITDKYAKMDFEVFLPSLGTIAGATPTVDEVPLVDWMGASGMALVLSTGAAKFTNSVASNEFLTIEVRRSSPGLTTQKTFLTTDNRGNVDLDVTIGTRAKLKFNFQGNLVSVTQKPSLTPDFGDQKAEHAPSFKSTTITQVELGLYNGAIPPTFTGTSNACFDKLQAPNVSGFEYSRYLTGCIDGWSKGATPTDVTITILEDSADATYNPDNHLEENHGLVVKAGTVTGKKVELNFSKLQLANVANSTVAAYTGQDLTFRNVEYTDIILS